MLPESPAFPIQQAEGSWLACPAPRREEERSEYAEESPQVAVQGPGSSPRRVPDNFPVREHCRANHRIAALSTLHDSRCIESAWRSRSDAGSAPPRGEYLLCDRAAGADEGSQR